MWTGSEMIIWGGARSKSQRAKHRRQIQSKHRQLDSHQHYQRARWPIRHTAVWTGSEMIVWGGGTDSDTFNTGGRYNPSTDSWTATSTTNAPMARILHTAVSTGSEMIIWGGGDQFNPFNTGGRYDPGTDSWTATSTKNAPLDGTFTRRCGLTVA